MAGTNPGALGATTKRKRHPLAKVKGGWTQHEDALLIKLVHELGEGNWSPIARALNAAIGKDDSNGRIGKQCRERWNHHLRPDIKKDAWTHEEEQMLVKAHQELGNRWSDIAKTIPGRSENAVKNHWNATLRRRDLPDPGPPGPLKTYMLGLNLIKPQSRPRRAQQPQQLPQAAHTQAGAGRSKARNTSQAKRGKRRGRYSDSEDEGDTTCSSSEECSAAEEAGRDDHDEEERGTVGSSWGRGGFTGYGPASGFGMDDGFGSRSKRLRTTAGAKLRVLVEAERGEEAGVGVGAAPADATSPAVSGCSTQCGEAEAQSAACGLPYGVASWDSQGRPLPAPSSMTSLKQEPPGSCNYGHACVAYPPAPVPPPAPCTTLHHAAAAAHVPSALAMGALGAAPCARAAVSSGAASSMAPGHSHGGAAAGAAAYAHAHAEQLGMQHMPQQQLQEHAKVEPAAEVPLQPRSSMVGTPGMAAYTAANPVAASIPAAAPAAMPHAREPHALHPGAPEAMDAAMLRNMALSPAALALEQALALSTSPSSGLPGVGPGTLLDADDVELIDMLNGLGPPPGTQQPGLLHHPPGRHATEPNLLHGCKPEAAAHMGVATMSVGGPTNSWAQMGLPSGESDRGVVSRSGSHSSLHSAYSHAVAPGPHSPMVPPGMPPADKPLMAHPAMQGMAAAMPSLPEHTAVTSCHPGLHPQQAGGAQAGLPMQRSSGGGAAPCWQAPFRRSESSGSLFSAPTPGMRPQAAHGGMEAAPGSAQPASPTKPASPPPILHASADGPGRVLLLTTAQLPPMEAMLSQYMPPAPGSSLASQSVTHKLGSKGPLRVCLPELQARLHALGVPSATAACKYAEGTAGFADSMVHDLSHMVHAVCRQVVAQQGLDGYVVGVRLGSDTPLHDYSVLLAVRGPCSERVSAGVEAISNGMAPLLC